MYCNVLTLEYQHTLSTKDRNPLRKGRYASNALAASLLSSAVILAAATIHSRHLEGAQLCGVMRQPEACLACFQQGCKTFGSLHILHFTLVNDMSIGLAKGENSEHIRHFQTISTGGVLGRTVGSIRCLWRKSYVPLRSRKISFATLRSAQKEY